MSKKKENAKNAKLAYSWRTGARLPLKAEVAVPVLERLRSQNNGRLTAAQVLDHARDPASPLHIAFDWDDSSAAEKHRLSQAGSLIMNARVTVVSKSGESKPVRAFVSVLQDEDEDATYTSTVVAMQDADLRGQILARARNDLAAWRKRYDNLQEFASLFEVIDEVIAA